VTKGQVDGTRIAVLSIGTVLVSEIETMRDERSVDGYSKVNAECRALIVCETAPAAPSHETPRPSATFVAQLLATKEDLPQTRERRREEPEVAVHVYEAHMAPVTPDSGTKLSRAA
jgi:hypothetical protein